MKKRYRYKGTMYSIKGLLEHKDCKVAEHEHTRNLWKKKLSVEEALITPIKLVRSKARSTYFYQGLEMTVAELSELPECEVSYYELYKNLRVDRTSVEDALKGRRVETEGEYSSGPKKTDLSKINTKPMGGSISFNKPVVRQDDTYKHYWLVLNRLGYEMNDQGMDLEKTLEKILD